MARPDVAAAAASPAGAGQLPDLPVHGVVPTGVRPTHGLRPRPISEPEPTIPAFAPQPTRERLGVSALPEPTAAQRIGQAIAGTVREKYRYKGAGPDDPTALPRFEREALRQVEQRRIYGAAAGVSPRVSEALVYKDLAEMQEHEADIATQVGSMIGELIDPTILVGGAGIEKAILGSIGARVFVGSGGKAAGQIVAGKFTPGLLHMAAARGSTLARRLVRLSNTPEGANFVRRVVARATHGAVTGGAQMVGFETMAGAQRGDIPGPGELAKAAVTGTVIGPPLAVGAGAAADVLRGAIKGALRPRPPQPPIPPRPPRGPAQPVSPPPTPEQIEGLRRIAFERQVPGREAAAPEPTATTPGVEELVRAAQAADPELTSIGRLTTPEVKKAANDLAYLLERIDNIESGGKATATVERAQVPGALTALKRARAEMAEIPAAELERMAVEREAKLSQVLPEVRLPTRPESPPAPEGGAEVPGFTADDIITMREQAAALDKLPSLHKGARMKEYRGQLGEILNAELEASRERVKQVAREAEAARATERVRQQREVEQRMADESAWQKLTGAAKYDLQKVADDIEAEQAQRLLKRAEAGPPGTAEDITRALRRSLQAGPKEVVEPPVREPGAPADEAAVQEGLFGEKKLVGSEQTELLGAEAGKERPKGIEPTKISTAEEIERVKREGGEPPGERPGELFQADKEVTKQIERHEQLSRQIARDEQIMGMGTSQVVWTDVNAHIGQPGQKMVKLSRTGKAYSAAGRLAQARKRLADLESKMRPDALEHARKRSELAMQEEAAAQNEKIAKETAPRVSKQEPGEFYSPQRRPMGAPRSKFGQFLDKVLGRKPDKENVQAMTLMDIGRKYAKAVGVPVRQGRIPPQLKAAGIFKPHEEVTRTQRYDDLDTVSHEVGHYISQYLLGNPTMKSRRAFAPALTRSAVKELNKMGRDLYGKRKPAAGYGEEGIAEWSKFYVIDRDALATKAPEFTKWMESEGFKRDPMLKRHMDQARQDFLDYQAAGWAKRIDASISVDERVRQAPDTRWLMKWWLDDLYEIEFAERGIRKGEASPAERSAYEMARLTRGNAGVAEEILERGMIRYGTDERVAPSVMGALRAVPRTKIQALRRYLDAWSTLDRAKRGIQSGTATADARAAIEAYRKDPAIHAAAEAIWQHYDKLLQYKVDAGRVTEAAAKRIRKANPHHVSFYRFFEPEETPATGGLIRRAFTRITSGLRRQVGSARRKLDPLENLISDTHTTVRDVHNADVAKALISLAQRTQGGGRFIEEVPAPVKVTTLPLPRVIEQLEALGITPEEGRTWKDILDDPANDLILKAFDEANRPGQAEARDLVIPMLQGEKVRFYQVKDRRLYDALMGLGTPQMEAWQRWLSLPARTLRTGATMTLEFAFGRNPWRDSWATAVYGHGNLLATRPPGWRFTEGLFHILKSDEKYQLFRLSGADHAVMNAIDRHTLQRSLDELIGGRTIGGHAMTVMRHPIDNLRQLFSAVENANRLGEFASILRAGKGRHKAALGARDIGVDFAQAGAATRFMNMLTWPFTAQVRGIAQLAREIRTRPGTVVPRAFAMITLPSVGLYLAQKDDPVYQDVPRWVKDASWVWVQRGDKRTDKWDGYGSGEVERVWVLPKPFELGVLFGTVPERIAEWLSQHNPESIESIMPAIRKAFVPPIIPSGGRALVENYANRSFHEDRPVVPRAREHLAPSEQSRERTGETYRMVGKALGYSPAKLENLARGIAGALPTYATAATDELIRRQREAAGLPPLVSRPRDTKDILRKIPLVKAFVRGEPVEEAESIEQFYKDFEQAEMHRQTYRHMQMDGRRDEARAYYQEHRADILAAAPGGRLRTAYTRISELQSQKRAARDEDRRDRIARRILAAARRTQARRSP